MTSGRELEMSRRKLLGLLGVTTGAAALGGTGTSAFFADSESLANNQLTAGELDLNVAYSTHYSDWSPDEDGSTTSQTDDDVSVRTFDRSKRAVGERSDLRDDEVGLPTADEWLVAVDDPGQYLNNTKISSAGTPSCASGGDAGETPRPVIDLNDIKPGDFGQITFDFTLCDNPGYVWLVGDLRSAGENGLTEPELDDEQEDGDPDSTDPADVELLDVVRAAYWIDDGNGYPSGTERPASVGTLRTILSELSIGGGAPIEGDLTAEEAGGTGRDCFSGETEHSVVVAWWVPVDHGNEIQSDSVQFDIGFYAEQCRHNDGIRTDSELALASRRYNEILSETASPTPSPAYDYGEVEYSGDGLLAFSQFRAVSSSAPVGEQFYLKPDGIRADTGASLFAGILGVESINEEINASVGDQSITLQGGATRGYTAFVGTISSNGEDLVVGVRAPNLSSARELAKRLDTS